MSGSPPVVQRRGYEALAASMRREEALIQKVIARSVRNGTVGTSSPHYGRHILELGEIADYLDSAADYIQHYGWTKGSRGKEGGPRCALGAIDSVVGEPNNRAIVRQAFAYSLIMQGAIPEYLASSPWLLESTAGTNIADWNDKGVREKVEVIASFRACAAYIRELAFEDAQKASFEDIWAGAIPLVQEEADKLLKEMGAKSRRYGLTAEEEDVIMAEVPPG